MLLTDLLSLLSYPLQDHLPRGSILPVPNCVPKRRALTVGALTVRFLGHHNEEDCEEHRDTRGRCQLAIWDTDQEHRILSWNTRGWLWCLVGLLNYCL